MLSLTLFCGAVHHVHHTLQDAMKEFQKKDTHQPKYGVLEGSALDAAGVDAISSLPTKTELYRRIAVGINAVPTKIARSINVSPRCRLVHHACMTQYRL